MLGDIGPFGGLMEPYGEFTEDQVRDAFNEQAKAIVDAGADAIIIETQTALEELEIAMAAAKEAGARLALLWERDRALREREKEQREREAAERAREQRR